MHTRFKGSLPIVNKTKVQKMSIFIRTNTITYRKKIEFCTERLFVSSKTGYEQIGDLSPNSLILFSLVTSRSCRGVKKRTTITIISRQK